jgi:hypothetical protein
MVGSNPTSSMTTGNCATNALFRFWQTEWRFTIVTTGSSGTFDYYATATMSSPLSANNDSATGSPLVNMQFAQAIDTTASNNIDFKVQLSASNASLSMEIARIDVEKISAAV